MSDDADCATTLPWSSANVILCSRRALMSFLIDAPRQRHEFVADRGPMQREEHGRARPPARGTRASWRALWVRSPGLQKAPPRAVECVPFRDVYRISRPHTSPLTPHYVLTSRRLHAGGLRSGARRDSRPPG